MKEKLIENFLRISSIPRMTGNEKEISNFFVEVAKKNNLEYYQDEDYNVLIKKKGNIEGTPIILQAHFDMVCVKTKDSKHDFNCEGIEVIIEGDKLTAKDTSLGADQGVGLAMMLTIIEDNTISHPDLEFLFTVEEETTFKGVVDFDYDKLNGKELINLDNSSDDTVFIGASGDIVNEYLYKLNLTEKDIPSYKVTLDGFKEGNSGENIEESKDNAIVSMARVLKDKDIYIKSITGGRFENDLASSCEVIIQTNLDINNIFNTNVKIESIDNKSSLSLEESKDIVNEILSLESGYLSDRSSANLGIVETTNDLIRIVYLIRSDNLEELENISNKTKELNYNFEFNNMYTDPIWNPDKDSELLKKYNKAYFNLYNEYPKQIICQGSIESASIMNRVNNLDTISIGANMNNIHSVNETTYISSWIKIYKVLLELLKY